MNASHLPSDLEKLLVSTKFAPPRIGARYIIRAQLIEALRRERHCRVTLVTGSAGFGKTILLAQWRQELMKAGSQVAWLSLNADEKLLANFRTHLLSALARLGVPLQEEMLLGEGSAEIEGTVAILVNSIAAIDEDLYLILDDYHHVEDPWAHRLVQKLIDHSPPNLHMVIASRALPPLSVAKLRVMGQVAEVECGDLPFNLAETRLFLEQNLNGIRLDADEVAQIHDFTNGWPASLQLVSILLKNHPESRSKLHNLAWQSSDLQNYLSEDVVGHLPGELSGFMESLSICRRFNASLAEAITGRPDAAALIERIEEENLLIMRAESDNRSPWFRFHPLFVEFLQTRLSQRGTKAVDALHQRASRWFADRRLVIEAIRHAVLAKDLDYAVAIVERSVPGTWKLSYLGPLLHLVENVSLEAIAAHPRLLYLGSLTLAMTSAPARAAAWVARLQDGVAEGDGGAGFKIALVNATIAFQNDDTARALALLETLGIGEAKSAFERYVFLMVYVTALAAAGRFTDALDVLDLNPIPAEDLDNDMAIRAAGCRSVALTLAGRVAEAEQLAEPMYVRAVAAHGRQSTCATLGAIGLADLCYELDRIDDARELLANRQSSLRTSSPQLMIWATLCKARLDLLQDSAETALAHLERQTVYFRSLGLERVTAYALAEQVRILVGQGNLQRAQDVTAKLEEMAEGVEVAAGFSAEILILAGLARARLDLGRGRGEEALRAVAGAEEIARGLGRGREQVTLGLIAVLSLHAAGRGEEALSRLADCARLGAELGLIRSFLDEGEKLRPLLKRVAETAEHETRLRDYAVMLLGRFSGGDDCGSAETADPKTRALLTPREIEILGLVAAGMSNKRIALTLGITLETVKWNLKNVFLKLGVSSRYDAMIWARRQGLIV